MTLIGDIREKEPYILENCDELWDLSVDEGEDDGTTRWSYDFLITGKDAVNRGDPRMPPRELRFERKAWPDFVQSWRDGRLERQVSYVDALIVEFDPLDIFREDNADLEPKPGEDNETYSRRLDAIRRARGSALKHLTALAFNLPVILSFGPAYTIDQLRYIEANPTLPVRRNKVRFANETTRRRILEALPGINTARVVGDGEAVGEKLERVVDWIKVAEGLNLVAWPTVEMPGAQRISLKRIERIAALLRGTEQDSR